MINQGRKGTKSQFTFSKKVQVTSQQPRKALNTLFPPLGIQYNLASQKKNLPLVTPLCDESKLPRKSPPDRSLKNVYPESGVIIIFDTTFTVQLLNPPEILWIN